MIHQRDCPICGGQVMFSYVRPDYDFYINEDGSIERDSNKDLFEGQPHLEFYCENDRTHDLNAAPSITEYRHSQQIWEEKVTEEFYKNIFPHL